MRPPASPEAPLGASRRCWVSRHGLPCVSGHSLHRWLALTVRIGKASHIPDMYESGLLMARHHSRKLQRRYSLLRSFVDHSPLFLRLK